jgi:hypothetical protein
MRCNSWGKVTMNYSSWGKVTDRPCELMPLIDEIRVLAQNGSS